MYKLQQIPQVKLDYMSFRKGKLFPKEKERPIVTKIKKPLKIQKSFVKLKRL
jgi:hypothetical protein